MPKHQFKIGIKNVVVKNNESETSTVEIHILDTIQETGGWDWWTDEKLPGTVETILNKLREVNPTTIKVTIDSEGGDAALGLAIYNLLNSYNATKEVDVIGLAGSIASVVAQCASPGKLRMCRNSFMVIHRAWGAGYGNSDDLRAAADLIDKYTNQIVDVYVQRTGLTAEKIKGFIANGDYWMTGPEAKELGFCDEVIDSNGQFQIAARVNSLDAHYKNIPQNLTNKDADTTVLNYLKDEVMNIKTLVSNFINSIKPKKEGDTEPAKEQVDLANNISNALEKPLEEFLTNIQKDLGTEVKNKLDEFKAADEFKTIVENAVKDSEVVKNLTKKVGDLEEENKELKNQLEQKAGGESKEKNDPPSGATWGGTWQ